MTSYALGNSISTVTLHAVGAVVSIQSFQIIDAVSRCSFRVFEVVRPVVSTSSILMWSTPRLYAFSQSANFNTDPLTRHSDQVALLTFDERLGSGVQTPYRVFFCDGAGRGGAGRCMVRCDMMG